MARLMAQMLISVHLVTQQRFGIEEDRLGVVTYRHLRMVHGRRRRGRGQRRRGRRGQESGCCGCGRRRRRGGDAPCAGRGRVSLVQKLEALVEIILPGRERKNK
jgi:hypothetical protein